MPRLDFLRPLNFFFFAILAASGYLVSVGSLGITTVLVKIVLSMLFLTVAANIFNEFSSSKIYSIIKNFYSRSKRNDVNRSAIVSVILFASGLAVAYSISVYTSLLYVLTAFLLCVYLFYLKNVPFVRSIFIGMAASVAVILGADAAGPSNTAYIMTVLLFFSNAAGDMVKSITEEMKDRTTFLVNLLKRFSSYMKFDNEMTKKAAAFSLAAFIITSPLPYVFGFVPISYLALITISSLIAFMALFSIVKNGKGAAQLAKVDELIKINMLVTIIAFLAGSLL